MNSELERLLPELARFKYKIRNPAKIDLQIDLVECVLNRLIWTDRTGKVPLKRATEVLNDYFRRKRSRVSRQVYLSPEKIRTIVFGLAKPFDKRTSEVGIINRSFRTIRKRMERFAMTLECTVCRREDVLTHYDTTMDFSFDRRSFLLNTRPVYMDRILKWWWNDENNNGFIRTSKGREIINRAGCLVRFLLYSQEEKKLAEFRYLLYTEIAERIGDAIRANQHGIVNTLVVCYAVFDSTPFFVDEGIIANVVNAVTELQFVDPWTIAFVDGTERRRKKSKRAIREKDYESFSDDRYEGLPINLVEQSDDEYSSDQSKYAKKILERRK